MAVVCHELVPDLYEGIGRPCHSGEDDDLDLVRGGDEVSDVADAFGGGYGGASKLHYFQWSRGAR